MNFDKIIQKRKSVKSFEIKKVKFEKILDAIDAANQGPFAGNQNNLKYIIVEDQKTLRRISKEAHQTWISNAQAAIVITSNDVNLENMYGERGRIYSRQQAGAAIMTLIFKLVDNGLSTCWVGAYTDELIRNILKIPGHMQVEAILPIAYEKKTKLKESKKRKKELENTIFWEEWDNKKRPTITKEPPVRAEQKR